MPRLFVLHIILLNYNIGVHVSQRILDKEYSVRGCSLVGNIIAVLKRHNNIYVAQKCQTDMYTLPKTYYHMDVQSFYCLENSENFLDDISVYVHE